MKSLFKLLSLFFGVIVISVNSSAQEVSYSDSIYAIDQKLSPADKLDFHYRLLAKAEKKKDTVAIIEHITTLANMNFLMKNYEISSELDQRIQGLSSEIDDPDLSYLLISSIAERRSNKAQLYKSAGPKIKRHQDPRFYEFRFEGIEIMRQALAIAEKNNLKERLPRAYYKMGQKMIFIRTLDSIYVDSVKKYLSKAITHAKQQKNLTVEVASYNWMGAVYKPTDQDSSLYFLGKADSIIKANDWEDRMWLNQNNVNFTFSAIALKAGLDTLITLRNRYLRYRTDQYVADFKTKIAEAENKYRVQFYEGEKQQVEQALALEQARLKQRNLIIGITLLLFIGAGGGGIFFFRLNRKNQQLAEDNALLVKEQNHRVKNNLQMISSLLSLQANKIDGESREHILNGSRRVQAIGLLHRKLYDDLNGLKEVNLKSYIKELVEDILYATNQPDIPVKLSLDDISIPVEKAIHLALILNELITNSIKHVFSKAQLNEEAIHIKLYQKEGSLNLSYKDNSGRFNVHQFDSSDSFGNRIIQMQSKYLGEFEIKDEHGFYYSLKFDWGE